MPIVVTCESCGQRFGAPERSAGKRGRCPACGEGLMVPALESAAPEPTPKLSSGGLDLDDLLEADASAPALGESPLDVPGSRRSEAADTRFLMRLCMGAGALLVVLLLAALLWPSAKPPTDADPTPAATQPEPKAAPEAQPEADPVVTETPSPRSPPMPVSPGAAADSTPAAGDEQPPAAPK